MSNSYRIYVHGKPHPITLSSPKDRLTVREAFEAASMSTNGYTFQIDGRDVGLDDYISAGGRVMAATKLAGGI